MKIANASLQMASSHIATARQEVRESLRMWVGRERPDFEHQRPHRGQSERVQLSDAGKAAQRAEAAEREHDVAEGDPRYKLLVGLIEALTGHKVRIFDAAKLEAARSDAADVPAPPSPAQAARSAGPEQRAGFGVEYDYHASYSETETTTFAASGKVVTADGRQIEFELQFAMQRSYATQTDISLRLGDAQRKDPLVINFAGTAAELTDTRFAFDLDADGATDRINFLQGGSGFLVFDRNHDGKANDGSELFGPSTGQGFAELAAHDDDRNGWIDENDAIYSDLRVWTRDAEGQDQLRTLQAANVGAISLMHVATPFDLKDAANQTLGKVQASGIYLHESGAVGSVQQIDLSV